MEALNSQKLHIFMEQMSINCVIGISSLILFSFHAFSWYVDSPNELSSMIDFHISEVSTFTKPWLLEELRHAYGTEWVV